MFHIHIGAHKVGSTSLQRFFALNAGLLEELGVVYPKVGLGEFAHHPVARAFTDTKMIDDREERKAELKALAGASPDKTFLLSSEAFEYVRVAGIHDLAETISPHSAQIIFYVRDFTQQIPSKYAQRTKTGVNIKDFDEFLDIAKEMRWLEFAKVATRWADCFGWDAMRVRVLDRDFLVGGDLLRDAWSLLGLPAEEFARCDPASLVRVNTSPNWVTLETVREVNCRLANADLALPADGRSSRVKQTRAKTTATQTVDSMRVGRLVDLCAEAAAEAGLAEAPGRYLTREQWVSLRELYRAQIIELNDRLPGAPLPVPPSDPPEERPFLPTFSAIPPEDRARMGRLVLRSPAVRRLPRAVSHIIATVFGLRSPRGDGRRPAYWKRAIAGLLGIVFPSPLPQRGSDRKDVEASQPSQQKQLAAGAAMVAGGRAAGGRATLLGRIQRRLTRLSRRLRREVQPDFSRRADTPASEAPPSAAGHEERRWSRRNRRDR